MAEQAGLYTLKLYENDGFVSTFDGSGNYLSLSTTGDTIEIEGCQKPKYKLETKKTGNNKTAYIHKFTFILYDFIDANIDILEQLKTSNYGWIAELRFMNGLYKFANTVIQFKSSELDNNSSNTFAISMQNDILSGSLLISKSSQSCLCINNSGECLDINTTETLLIN